MGFPGVSLVSDHAGGQSDRFAGIVTRVLCCWQVEARLRPEVRAAIERAGPQPSPYSQQPPQ